MNTVLAPGPSSPPSATDSGVILFVEDDPAIREMMTRELRQAGYRILAAGHGAEALNHFLREGENIDLVISDPRRSGTDAIALFTEMRSRGTLRGHHRIPPQTVPLCRVDRDRRTPGPSLNAAGRRAGWPSRAFPGACQRS
jgi:CheY-like chemotaxis protein